MESGPWTARELLSEAQRRLGDCPAPRDARARAELTLRNLRYYIAAGLVDRPSALRGRAGLYDQRQLAQLVAIKRWQAEGLELRQITQRLHTTGDLELAQLCDWRSASKQTPACPAEVVRDIELLPGVRLLWDDRHSFTTSQLKRFERLLRAAGRRRRASAGSEPT